MLHLQISGGSTKDKIVIFAKQRTCWEILSLLWRHDDVTDDVIREFLSPLLSILLPPIFSSNWRSLSWFQEKLMPEYSFAHAPLQSELWNTRFGGGIHHQWWTRSEIGSSGGFQIETDHFLLLHDGYGLILPPSDGGVPSPGLNRRRSAAAGGWRRRWEKGAYQSLLRVLGMMQFCPCYFSALADRKLALELFVLSQIANWPLEHYLVLSEIAIQPCNFEVQNL